MQATALDRCIYAAVFDFFFSDSHYVFDLWFFHLLLSAILPWLSLFWGSGVCDNPTDTTKLRQLSRSKKPASPIRFGASDQAAGVRGFHAVDLALKFAAFPARPGPLIPSPSPPQSRGRRVPEDRLRDDTRKSPRSSNHLPRRRTRPGVRSFPRENCERIVGSISRLLIPSLTRVRHGSVCSNRHR